jgi:glycosyltransferase involved in cell wall biosynthesis
VADFRIGIDISPLALTRAGTARHITELLAELDGNGALDIRRYQLRGSGPAAKIVRDTAWYLAVLPAQAKRDGCDLLHCPTFRAPVTSAMPFVVTVHDLAVLRHPWAFNRWSRHFGARTLPMVVRAARSIVAVSEFTRNELIELLDVPAAKIQVVPNGVGAPFTDDGPAAGGHYVLAVSTLEPRKNMARLLEGFKHVGLDGYELRVVGARGWGDVRVEGKRVRWLGEVDNEQLAMLYRGALSVAYVSLYEGFGLPILEAMACGAPVVTTRWGACAEVAGDAGVLVDSLDPEAIAAGLRDAAGRHEELSRLGRERARRFRWDRTARETVEVYRKALE